MWIRVNGGGGSVNVDKDFLYDLGSFGLFFYAYLVVFGLVLPKTLEKKCI